MHVQVRLCVHVFLYICEGGGGLCMICFQLAVAVSHLTEMFRSGKIRLCYLRVPQPKKRYTQFLQKQELCINQSSQIFQYLEYESLLIEASCFMELCSFFL